MKKIVVTGGAGFIGSHIVDFMIKKYPAAKIVVLDKMTYAADFRYLSQHSKKLNFQLIVGDICDHNVCLARANKHRRIDSCCRRKSCRQFLFKLD